MHLCLLPLVGLLAGTGCAASRAYSRGMQAQRAGRHADAAECLEQAVEHDPGNPSYSRALAEARAQSAEAMIARGEELEFNGEYALANGIYEAAFRLDPLNDYALLKRQLVGIRLRKMHEAQQSVARTDLPHPTTAIADMEMEQTSVANAERPRPVERYSREAYGAARTAAIRFEPSKIDLAAGRQFPVEVIVSTRVWPSSGAFDVIYDERAMRVTSVESGAMAGSYSVRQPEPGRISFKFLPEERFDGVACRLTFVAGAPTLAGLHIDRARLKDYGGEELDVATSPASINVHPAGAEMASSASAPKVP
ncbi:MAG: hypothetical protein AB1714_14900 [Acidobacteriota bacterium]